MTEEQSIPSTTTNKSSKKKDINQMSVKDRFKGYREFKPDLREYLIKSKILDEDKKYFLPTPQNFNDLFQTNVIKDLVFYDQSKYEKLFSEQDGEEVIDFSNIKHLQNPKILTSILFFLGAINSENDIYEFFDEEESLPPLEEENYFENGRDYLEYIEKNLELMTREIVFIDLGELLKALEEIGITIPEDNKNIIYRDIKDFVMKMPENKIMILLVPSNNFWVKTEKSTINGINYDIKINNYTKLYYNNIFIEKFLSKVSSHPRCHVGFLSSMIKKNIRNGIGGIVTLFKKEFPEDYSVIDQSCHDVEDMEKKDTIPKFYRNLNKIMNHLKSSDKLNYFNESNIVIIESKDYKISETTKDNSVLVSVFNEKLIEGNENERKKLLEKKADLIIDYIIELLENCPNDVRDYLTKNPFNKDTN